jgi:uncharacterized protein YndB with AHSA1/START domain
MPEQDLTITVNRTIDAPQQRVWQAWTDAGEIAQWWGPDGAVMTIDEIDVRSGGVFRFSLEMANGYKFPSVITYDEVIEPSSLVYTYDPGKESGLEPTKTSFSFKAVGEKTEIKMQFHYATAAEKDKHVNQFGAVKGAEQTLERLEEYLDKDK